jgi:hypothetical protein
METAVKPAIKRVRGENLRVFKPFKPGLTFDQILPLVDKEGLVIASNKRLDRALVDSKDDAPYHLTEWQLINSAFPCWSGTLVAYARPGAEFGGTIIYGAPDIRYNDPGRGIKYILSVPQEYQKVKNGILIAEHPGYVLAPDGPNSFVVNATKVDLLEKFPAKNGWYLPDDVHGIPCGSEVDEKTPGARNIHRISDTERISFVARDCGNLYYVGRDVFLSWPSAANGLQVLVEAP